MRLSSLARVVSSLFLPLTFVLLPLTESRADVWPTLGGRTFHLRPVIMLTGYWSPTNEMLRPFSPLPSQNPGGWKGENWQNSGYDIVALFPEFPGATLSGEEQGEGVGHFRVNEASTLKDFNTFTAALRPVAILSFGLGDGPWELESQAKDYWSAVEIKKDYRTTLPREAIRSAVNAEVPELLSWIDEAGDAGAFLCGYLSWLGAAYAEEHWGLLEPYPVRAQGFIHVNDHHPLPVYERALGATLRAVIHSLRTPQSHVQTRDFVFEAGVENVDR